MSFMLLTRINFSPSGEYEDDAIVYGIHKPKREEFHPGSQFVNNFCWKMLKGIQEYNSHGWWIGQMKGTIGLVPKDYLIEMYDI
ncbi:uncharacterized protein [Scyliorhinus torazame]|uniref:uncharacterized protein isoform X3 n=1 Tax=Scyliorhinus torazame TaxID=75743 RepID=UPI003B5AFE5E